MGEAGETTPLFLGEDVFGLSGRTRGELPVAEAPPNCAVVGIVFRSSLQRRIVSNEELLVKELRYEPIDS